MAKGLYNKYHLTKSDGTPVDPTGDYFILRLDTDPRARVAVELYAKLMLYEITDGQKETNHCNRQFAQDIMDHLQMLEEKTPRTCLLIEEMGLQPEIDDLVRSIKKEINDGKKTRED